MSQFCTSGLLPTGLDVEPWQQPSISSQQKLGVRGEGDGTRKCLEQQQTDTLNRKYLHARFKAQFGFHIYFLITRTPPCKEGLE